MKESPIDLLKQIEALILEIFSTLILYPKTFATVLLRPRQLTSLIDKELEKPTGERFDAYSSPVVYWLLTLLPLAYYSYALSRKSGGLAKFFFSPFFTVTVDILMLKPGQALPKVPAFGDFFLEIAIPYAMVPFAFSAAVQLARRSHFSKTSMAAIYFEQFYLFGTLSGLLAVLQAGLFFPVFDFLERFRPVVRGLGIVLGVFGISWYIYAQVHVIQNRTSRSRTAALVIISGAIILAVFLTWATDAVLSHVMRLD